MPYPSEGRQNENHSDRKLIKLITWTTALSNSMKLGLHKTDGLWWRVLTKCSPLEKGMANHFIFFLENTVNSMKRQKDRILKEELPRSVVPNLLLEISGEITPEIMKGRRQNINNSQLQMEVVIEARFDTVKSNIV